MSGIGTALKMSALPAALPPGAVGGGAVIAVDEGQQRIAGIDAGGDGEVTGGVGHAGAGARAVDQ